MRRIRGLLVDLDGVLYEGSAAVPGAPEAVSTIRERRIPVRFVSNSTRRSRASVASHLKGMGFSVPEEEILTPAVTAARLLASEGVTRCLFLTTGDVITDFQAEGISPAEDGTVLVVGDAGEAFTYPALNRAMRVVLDGAAILALEKDRYWMAADGLSLSAGPFVAALEFATGKTARLVGKPSPEFFGLALRDMDIPAVEAAMVGDDILTDIAGAQRAGMAGILVRTGKFREDAVAASGIIPDGIIGSVADLPGLLFRE